MADLEELGYILQPHTSAGRIPSDQGYRLYVDMLMEMCIRDRFELNHTGLLAYSHGEYLGLGKSLGRFGWSVKKR